MGRAKPPLAWDLLEQLVLPVAHDAIELGDVCDPVELRHHLSRLTPVELWSTFFASPPAGLRRPALVDWVREQLSEQAEAWSGESSEFFQLLRRVYGARDLFARVTAAPTASASKRALVGLLMQRANARDPWLSSRLIHTWAFRPRAMPPQSARTRREAGAFPRVEWGPLYKRVLLDKPSGGTRTLHIPNPPLRRLQRNLLREVLTPALEHGVSRSVFGIRRGRDAGLHATAREHLQQHYFVSFDLRDFFSAASTRDLIPALLRLRRQRIPMLVEESITRSEDDQTCIRRVHHPWTEDAAVLVAHLVTRHGRVPQGAPTSPAAASLAFSKYDARIMARLGPDCVYTRYFDDITVSVSRASAGRLAMDSPADLRKYAERCIQAALRQSPFQLNHKKTRMGTASRGHRILGLRVLSNSVALPRKRKRELRGIHFALERYGLISTALRRIGGEVLAETRFKPGRGHVRGRRRLSSERLAVVMLRRLDPSLEVQRQELPTRLQTGVAHPSVLRGKLAARAMEQLLEGLWRGNYKARLGDSGTVHVSDQGSEVGIRGEPRVVAFFLLGLRAAVSATELWHRLWGLCLSLKPPDSYRSLRDLHVAHSRLKQALSNVTFEIPDGRSDLAITTTLARPSGTPLWPAPPQEATVAGAALSDSISQTGSLADQLTPEGRLKILLLHVGRLLSRFVGYVGSDTRADWDSTLAAFSKVVTTQAELGEWLDRAASLCFDQLARLPDPGGSPIPKGVPDVWRCTRYLADMTRERRSDDYQVVRMFLNRWALRLPTDRPRQLQRHLAHDMELLLDAALGTRRDTAASIEDWVQSQSINRWRRVYDHSQLSSATESKLERFSSLYRELTPDGGTRVFQSGIWEQCSFESLRQSVVADASRQERWDSVYNSALELVRPTTDALEGEGNSKERRTAFEGRLPREQCRDSQLLNRTRNRAGHVVTPEHRTDAEKTQRDLARLLGRSPHKAVKTRPFENLALTSLEASELKLLLLDKAIGILEALR
jgi:hypothetical protein